MDPQQKRTAETFDAVSGGYAGEVDRAIAFTGLGVDFVTRVKADYIALLARRHFGSTRNLRLLDVGCGIGNFHPLLSRDFGSIAGVDVSAESIEVAGRRNPAVSYRHYDGGRLPHDDASFDVAMTVCVMHHVPPADWPGFAAEMHRVVRPGGVAMVFEHNPLNPVTRRAVNNCPFDADAVLLSRGRTRALLQQAGFGSVEVRTILSVPPWNGALLALDRGLGLLPFGAQYYAIGVRP